MTHKFAVQLEQLHRLVAHVKAAAKCLRKLNSERIPESVLAYASYLAKKGNAPDSRAFLSAADDLREMNLKYSSTVLDAFVEDLEPHLVNALSRLEAHFEQGTPLKKATRRAKGKASHAGEITLTQLARLAQESGLISAEEEDYDDEALTAMDEYDMDNMDMDDEIDLEGMGDTDLEDMDDDDMDMYEDDMDDMDMEDNLDLDDSSDLLDDFGDTTMMDLEDEDDFLDDDYASRSSRSVAPLSKRATSRSSAQKKRRARRTRYV